MHFPISCSWQSRTAFETGRRTRFYSPPPHQSSSAHSRCLSKRIMKSWFRGLVDTPVHQAVPPLQQDDDKYLGQAPPLCQCHLSSEQCSSNTCKPHRKDVNHEDRHEDTTPHGTCHTAQLFLFALNIHPTAMISVCVLLSPCHRQPPTRCGSTGETLLEDVTQQFAHKTEKGTFLRQCTPQIHPLYCTYTFNISSL